MRCTSSLLSTPWPLLSSLMLTCKCVCVFLRRVSVTLCARIQVDASIWFRFATCINTIKETKKNINNKRESEVSRRHKFGALYKTVYNVQQKYEGSLKY